MNDIRILIPFYKRRNSDGGNWSEYTYNKFLIDFTRPLRTSNEWTNGEKKIISDEQTHWSSEELIDAILDIATRPAPVEEHKPCAHCNGKPRDRDCDYEDLHTEYYVICSVCGIKTNLYSHIAEAWAAWDRRADEKASSVAPKLDLWYEMDKALDDHVTNGIVWKSWVGLKKAEGKQ